MEARAEQRGGDSRGGVAWWPWILGLAVLSLLLTTRGDAEEALPSAAFTHSIQVRDARTREALVGFPLRLVDSRLAPEVAERAIETDSEGRFEVPVTRTSTIVALREGWSVGTVHVPGLLRDRTLVAWPVVEIEGRLSRASAFAPPRWSVVDVDVVVEPVAETTWNEDVQDVALAFHDVRVAPDGTFRLTLPQLGTARLRFEAPDTKTYEEAVDLLAAEGPRRVLPVVLEREPGVWVDGRIVGGAGNPVSGARVSLAYGSLLDGSALLERLLGQRYPTWESLEGGSATLAHYRDPDAPWGGRHPLGKNLHVGPDGRFAFLLLEPADRVEIAVLAAGHAPVHVAVGLEGDVGKEIRLELDRPVEPARVRIDPGLFRLQEGGEGPIRFVEQSAPGVGLSFSLVPDAQGEVETTWLVPGRRYRVKAEGIDAEGGPVPLAASLTGDGRRVIRLEKREE